MNAGGARQTDMPWQQQVGRRISQRREALGLLQEDLGRLVGVDRSTVAHWESGAHLPKNLMKLQRLAQALETALPWLMGSTDDPDPGALLTAEIPVKAVPLLGSIQAGWDHLAQAEWGETVWVPAGQPIDFCLRVNGDSMIPEVRPGDLVCCRRTSPDHPAQPGDLVVALLNGEEGTLKRLRHVHGQWVLHSTNPAYPDRILQSGDDPVIQAVVVQIQHAPLPDREEPDDREGSSHPEAAEHLAGGSAWQTVAAALARALENQSEAAKIQSEANRMQAEAQLKAQQNLEQALGRFKAPHDG